MSRNHRRVNNNTGNNNVLPNNVITMPMQLWTDPTFWQNNDDPEHFVTVNGKQVPNTTTLRELGLNVTQNNVYSDPGNYNAISPLALPPPAIVNEVNARIKRSLAMPKKKRTLKKAKKTSAGQTRNNRFGFKRMFRTLGKKLGKLTRGSRRI